MNPLESSQAELEQLLKQRAELDRKIDVVRQAIKIFEPVYAEFPTLGVGNSLVWALDEMGHLGITAAIERVLMTHPNSPLPPTVIRDLLVEAKFNLVGDNPLASIHQVLKRLVSRKGPFVVEELDGQTVYKYDASSVTRTVLYPSPAHLATSSFPVEAHERINAIKKAAGGSEVTPPPEYQPPRYKGKK